MMFPALPSPGPSKFNFELPGICGEFGSGFGHGLGAGVQAFYIQTVLTPAQLDWTTLISEIPGSERWPVRALFQRNVDTARVTDEIFPYLQEPNRIKFFNPLTLTLLPVEDGRVVAKLQTPKSFPFRDPRNHLCHVLESPGVFQFAWRDAEVRAGTVRWNSLRARLVAIDGQHRLSALKRLRSDVHRRSQLAFNDWRIPAVIVYFRRTKAQKHAPNLLDIVRRIFVDINMQARSVQEERLILLSDEDAAALCTQEIVQRAHSNDLAATDRDEKRLPLLFFDWRGEKDIDESSPGPTVKSIVEVRDWFHHFFEIQPGAPECLRAFDITDDSLSVSVVLRRDEHRLDYQTSKDVRERARQSIVPALSHLLQEFTPIAEYTRRIRRIEQEIASGASDVANLALDRLRFGASGAMPTDLAAAVNVEVRRLLAQIGREKRAALRPPFNLDVGMRGVVAAFAALRRACGHPDWVSYARWFAATLNTVYDEGWLSMDGTRNPDKGLLLHIVYAPDDTIVNYRVNQVGDALGAYTQLCVLARGAVPTEWGADVAHVKSGLLKSLRKPLRRGYKKEARQRLAEDFPDGGKPLDAAAGREADRLVQEHIGRITLRLRHIPTGRVLS